jgi:hypothetical protein
VSTQAATWIRPERPDLPLDSQPGCLAPTLQLIAILELKAFWEQGMHKERRR